MAEPFIQKAIDYDSGHAAKDALRKWPGSAWCRPGWSCSAAASTALSGSASA